MDVSEFHLVSIVMQPDAKGNGKHILALVAVAAPSIQTVVGCTDAPFLGGLAASGPPPRPGTQAGGGGCVGLPDHPPPTMPFRPDEAAPAHSRSPGADAAAGKGASPTRHRRRGLFFGARRLAPEFARRPPKTSPRSPRGAHDPPACAPYFSCLPRVHRHGNGNGGGSGNGTPTSDPPSATSICSATFCRCAGAAAHGCRTRRVRAAPPPPALLSPRSAHDRLAPSPSGAAARCCC